MKTERDYIKERNDKIMELRAEGHSLRYIAREVNLTYEGVRYVILDRAGMRRRGRLSTRTPKTLDS